MYLFCIKPKNIPCRLVFKPDSNGQTATNSSKKSSTGKKSLYSPKTILLFSIIKGSGPEPLKTKIAQEQLKLKVCACQSSQLVSYTGKSQVYANFYTPGCLNLSNQLYFYPLEMMVIIKKYII